jgi:hypothetical protein
MKIEQSQEASAPEISGWIITLEANLNPLLRFPTFDGSGRSQTFPDFQKHPFMLRLATAVLGGPQFLQLVNSKFPGVQFVQSDCNSEFSIGCANLLQGAELTSIVLEEGVTPLAMGFTIA